MVFFFIDGSFVVNKVGEPQIFVCGKEGFFDCSCDGLTLVFDSEAQVFGIGSKAVENENRVFGAELCPFLQFLDTGNDFSREAPRLQILALSGVKQNTELLMKYIMRSPPMASSSLMLSFTNFS